jgi:hypothetical protein
MSRRSVAFAVLALTGAAFVLPAPAVAAGGMRGGMVGGGFRAPMVMPHGPRAVLPVSPRAIARSAFTPRLGHGLRGHALRSQGLGSGVRHAIPPSPHGYATTTPLRPFGRLARRHHGMYHQGWYFPTTIGDDVGYIGTPYDPSETIPVYGPAPAYDEAPYPPAPRRAPAAAARAIDAGDDNRDACRAETVTVPARDGEREIRVVRC